MKTVHFPYTTIAPRQAQRLAALWGAVTLLQPSEDSCLPETKSLLEAGLIETLIPPADHRGALQGALNDFKKWAAQHPGGDLAALMEQGQAIPFFNGQSSAQIVAEIRKGDDRPESSPDDRPGQRIFQAQLLLAMAQELDIQQRELARDMAALALKEKEMMVLLKGEAEGKSEENAGGGVRLSAGSDPMLTLRLKAWARVIQFVPDMASAFAGSEILFVTDRRSVLEHIQEFFPEAQTRLWAYRLTAGSSFPEEAGRLPDWLMAPLRAGGQPEPAGSTDAVFDLIEIPHVAAEIFPLVLTDRLCRTDTTCSIPATDVSCWIGCLAMPGDDLDNVFGPDGF